MASAIAHAAASTAIGSAYGLSRESWRLVLLGALCAVLPDADALGYWAGIPYDHLFGHRGFSHSMVFALLLGLSLAGTLYRDRSAPERLFIAAYLTCATLSHGLLDALTNGGLGVAFFAPFSGERYFFPVRPIEVSPLEPARFFTARGLAILASEVIWVGLPSLALAAAARVLRGRRPVSENGARDASSPAARPSRRP